MGWAFLLLIIIQIILIIIKLWKKSYITQILSLKKKEMNEPNYDFNKKENLLVQSIDDKNTLAINDEMDSENDQELIFRDYNENNGNNENFPKLNFFDFLSSGINGGICFKENIQKMIQKCNEIVSKYYSIECIIYNLMKLENLLKDYRWNNPALSNVENNELILQLKNLISSSNNR